MAIGSNDIFISYGRGKENSPGSKVFTSKLYEALEGKGYDVWLDNQDIPHAVDFQKEINEGIKNSDNFIFIISPHAVASLYCMQEIQLAVELKKRIIPILHIMPNAELLEDSLHPEIQKLNWIYFDDESQFETSLEKLEAALVTDQNYLSKHTEYTTKAVNWRENNRNNDLFLMGSALREAESWLKTAEQKNLEPPASNIQKEYISKSRKYNNYRNYRRVAAIIVFVLVSSTLSLALYYNQQEKIAAREALKNIQLANSNELIAKANTVQCEESVEMGLRIAALAYEADTTNEMAQAALFDTFYKTFKGDTVAESTIDNLKGWDEKVIGKKGDVALLRDPNNIDYFNSKGEKLATFKSDKNFVGLHYDSEKQIIYAKTENDEIVTYHLKTEWVLKNMEKRNVPNLNDEQLNRFGIEKDLYKNLRTKLEKFQSEAGTNNNKDALAQAPTAKKESQKEQVDNAKEKVANKTEPIKEVPKGKSLDDYLKLIKSAFNDYESAEKANRFVKANSLHRLSLEAFENFSEDVNIKKAYAIAKGYLSNEFVYKKEPDSAILLADQMLEIAPKETWVNKTKVLAHLQKNDFTSAAALSKTLLDKRYPLANDKTYSEVLRAELDALSEEATLNQAQSRFLKLITVLPVEFSGFLINDRSKMTSRADVSLKIYAKGATEMMVSNTPQFSDNASWESYKNIKSWKLQAGQGKKTVYIKFRNQAGEETKVFQQSILLTRY